ncbi:torsin-1A-like [Acanthaster planci]|uniref:Torsin-1A-like n=1 Tax=Acanthaster planci TaxID=133434 RepID=A0A8B8A6C3_ACAPL|nr:torsin-1A-like [Acanthaster planci]
MICRDVNYTRDDYFVMFVRCMGARTWFTMALAAILSSSLQSSSSTRAQTLIRLILTCAVCIHIARAFSFNDVAKYVDKPWCLMECCQVDFGWIIHTNTSGLQEALSMQVFGQHLVTDHVVGAVDGHLTNKDPNKPLVLSFHGSTGTGKNYVARIIAETIYKEGMNSRYVHHFSANKHFPHKRKLKQYQNYLRRYVKAAVAWCPFRLFIFDEVEDMPEGLLDSIRTFLDYNIHIDGVDFRKTIFIFLSNIAALEISQKTADHLLAGRSRTEITLKEMEKVIEVTAIDASGECHSRKAGTYSRDYIECDVIGLLNRERLLPTWGMGFFGVEQSLK